MKQPLKSLSEELFERDNFASRRTTGHNLYDPNSLMSGAESENGFTYANSTRKFPDVETELAAVDGRLTTEEILKVGPRVFTDGRHFGKVSLELV